MRFYDQVALKEKNMEVVSMCIYIVTNKRTYN